MPDKTTVSLLDRLEAKKYQVAIVHSLNALLELNCGNIFALQPSDGLILPN
jgi:hypothetical protein